MAPIGVGILTAPPYLLELCRDVLQLYWRNYNNGGGLWDVIALPHFLFAICFMLVVKDVNAQLPVSATMPTNYCHAFTPTIMDS